MKRIAAIELHNFLAFYGTDNKISLPKGENLLLYGENGSGKSSLCRALEVFFDARNHPNFGTQQRNIWATPTDAPTDLKVQFLDKTVTPPTSSDLDFAAAKAANWIEESRLASGFLTYRDILKTHFLEESRRNLFDLVVNEILRGYKNPTSGKILSEEWAEFEKVWDDFLKEKWGDPLSTRTDEFGDEKKVMDIIDDLISDFGEVASAFDDSLKLILKDLNPKINEFLAFFEQNISIELVIGDHLDRFGNPIKGTHLSYHNLDDDIDLLKELRDRAVDPDVQQGVKTLLQNLTLKKPLLTAEVHYFGRFIPEHQTFLNEARLSALAVCIFLAALRLKPDPKDGCKILFLDDVLIGLDSGNRKPLLDILEKHFPDFQTMISTYDRYWYELAKDWLPNSDWNMMEMYVRKELDKSEKIVREIPALVPNDGHLEKARAYFEQFDYPAAGNALRKACEQFLKNYLPPTRRITRGADEITMLEPLLVQLETFYDDCQLALPSDFARELRYSRKAVLNPASHDDLKSPLYRREIEKLFDFVRELKKLPGVKRELVLDKDQVLVYENAAHSYKAKILVGEPIFKVTCNGKVTYSLGNLYMDEWECNGVPFAKGLSGTAYTTEEVLKIKQDPWKPEKLCIGIQKNLGLADTPVFLKEFSTNSIPLEQLLT